MSAFVSSSFPGRFAALLLTIAVCACAYAQPRTGGVAAVASTAEVSRPIAVQPVRIVVGFMGGRVHADNAIHREFTVARDLREQAPGERHVLMFANHDRAAALSAILDLLDQNGDHELTAAERSAADIAIFGHSWGASETVDLARQLQMRGVPVAVTVQVDSVQKTGENDRVIPSNVAAAANFYQRGGLLRGRPLIVAEDPSKTRILANQQFFYRGHRAVDIARFPWFARTFMRQHIMIENDPGVWQQVEELIENAMK